MSSKGPFPISFEAARNLLDFSQMTSNCVDCNLCLNKDCNLCLCMDFSPLLFPQATHTHTHTHNQALRHFSIAPDFFLIFITPGLALLAQCLLAARCSETITPSSFSTFNFFQYLLLVALIATTNFTAFRNFLII